MPIRRSSMQGSRTSMRPSPFRNFKPSKPGETDMSKLPAYVVIVAVLVIIGFGWLCFELMGAATSLPKDEQFRWDHMVVVFNSVQTMAAAALGVLLGTTVQQARV